MRLFVCALVAIVAAGCSLRDLDHLDRGSIDDGGGVETDSEMVDAAKCPTGMVQVASYCIDSTEVTEREYASFLTAKGGNTSDQIAVCASNTSFAPDPAFFPKNPVLPVRGIDWCDAYAFCAWAGKRLCGRIGGGATPLISVDDAELDQWFRACSAAGIRNYPYGDTFDGTACRGSAAGSGAVPVKTMTKCEGGFPGIFDMSGNVWEWVDACDDDAGTCILRGGAWSHDGVAMGCAYRGVSYKQDRLTAGVDRGVRCCID